MSKQFIKKSEKNDVFIYIPPIINTHYRHTKPMGQKNIMPHMTSPDMSMKLVELIDRYASGVPVDIGQTLYYDGVGHECDIEDDMLLGQNWEQLDIVEKHEYLKQGNRDFSRIQEGVKKAQAEKAREIEKQRKDMVQREKEFDEWRAQNVKKGSSEL